MKNKTKNRTKAREIFFKLDVRFSTGSRNDTFLKKAKGLTVLVSVCSSVIRQSLKVESLYFLHLKILVKTIRVYKQSVQRVTIS